LPKFHLVLVIHSHQPAGNFDGVFEQIYQRSYRPFLESIARHPAIRMGLHYSGPLLEWCEQHHPEFLDLLRQLVANRQVELAGGGV
jgi:alpha-amylase